MKIIALYSMKGGVGKTAASVNIAYHAAQSGKQTLLVDIDPQASAGYYFRIKPAKKHGSDTLIRGGKKIDKNIRATDFENLDLLPADMTYRNLDLILDDLKKPQKQLKTVLSPLKKEYDYIIMDCPPNITLVSENVFHAADSILTPLIPTTLSHLTYEKLLDFFREMKLKKSNVYPFFSMVEKRKKLHQEMIVNLPKEKKRFLKTTIPYSSIVERMGVERAPVNEFNPGSAAAQAFKSLWEEIKKL
ncbi:MAG: ParA family protein [Calditrichaeota bacterium]|nr:MAG: ParA family protein [Calditrichota bacterium]MBL1204934.1 ParA family protein [Calditrichota bacterium]NOG44763.1 AAA family ATPase [Calditrichota bacterium]